MSYQTLLLIDDDEDDQEIFVTAASAVSESVRCIAILDAREALRKLSDKEINPDVIFLDLNMPIMNGQQFLSELKKHHELRAIPVIIFSTSSSHHTIKSLKDLGASDFITKPSLYNELVEILKPLLT